MRARTRGGFEGEAVRSCFLSVAGNGAGVELLRAARGHAWLRRTRDTSRVSEGDLLKAIRMQLGCSVVPEAS